MILYLFKYDTRIFFIYLSSIIYNFCKINIKEAIKIIFLLKDKKILLYWGTNELCVIFLIHK